ncbi:MAG: peptidase M13, partial [Propionibacteriaceae bacterium]|nr:peptidase M13 [Propionibacteriaceae bacterium]
GAPALNTFATAETEKVAKLYACFMAEDHVDALGIEPITGLVAQIDAISSIDELLRYFGTSLRRGTGAPFGVEVDADPGDPSKYALFVEQDGLGLPDEEYYRLAEHSEIRNKYSLHIDTMLTLAGVSSSASNVIFALETKIASFHWDKVRTRNIQEMYNPTSEADWCADGVCWSDVLRAAGIPPQERVIVSQPSFFTGLATLLKAATLDEWKLWAKWALVSSMASYLPRAVVQANFDFYGTVLQGTPKLRDRWKRGVSLVEGLLGEAVGKLYVERYFPTEAKKRMDELVSYLIKAYHDSITALDWMGEATKAEALRKLSKFTPKIGYPDIWMDYTDYFVAVDDLIGNVLRGSEFHFKDEISKLGEPIRKHEWLMTPQTVNAYYHPLRNEIVFPAAILQPPFFDMNADDAENYGGIGAVIGHEIGHGFDDQGSTCDGDGRLRDWWTSDDREAFEKRTGALISQYDTLETEQLPGVCVNGELTIGENIGDLGGLGIAFCAWKLAQAAGGSPSQMYDYSPEQRFFFAWAKCWEGKSRDEALRQQIATDPHAPDEFRCNQSARNLDAYYDAFDVKESDAAWLPPEERVKIW